MPYDFSVVRRNVTTIPIISEYKARSTDSVKIRQFLEIHRKVKVCNDQEMGTFRRNVPFQVKNRDGKS